MKIKVCTKCKKRKNIKEFSFRNKKKKIKHNYCKECFKIYKKKYYIINKEKLNKKTIKYNNQHPFKKLLYNIKYRCNNFNSNAYKRYGGRGIKCLIIEKEIKKLWFRDKAYNMNDPTIDRIDNDGNYEYNNCRFIERNKNSYKSTQENMTKIIQFDKQGNFIKEWDNIKQICSIFKTKQQQISACCRGIYKTSNDYVWRYKNEV